MKIWLVSPKATSASLKHSSSKSLSSNFFFFPIFMLFIFLMPDGESVITSISYLISMYLICHVSVPIRCRK